MIDVQDLTAAYGPVTALKGVSLTVHKGEIFGLLGPNGAGKSTLLACVEGLHKPKNGHTRIGGMDVQSDPAGTKRQLGIQLQKTALLDDLTVAELVEVYAALYEVYLSRGQIDSLLARFDEPTSALDPHARRAVWDIVRHLHDEGRTIVLTTHAMEEAEALCGRIAIIDRGQIVACDTPAALIATLNLNSMLKATVELPLEQVRALPDVSHARYSGQHLEVETARPEVTMVALQELAVKSGRSIRDVMLRQPNLEDVFLKLTGHGLAEEAA
jgi:ABC-2 type transport system ATP-binding protein